MATIVVTLTDTIMPDDKRGMRASEETIEIISRPMELKPKAKRDRLRGLLAFWAAYAILLFWGDLGTVEVHWGILMGLTLSTLVLLFEWMPQSDRGWKILANPEYLEIRTGSAQLWSAGMASLTDWNKRSEPQSHLDWPHAEYLVLKRTDGDQFAVELAQFHPEDVDRLLDYLNHRAGP